MGKGKIKISLDDGSVIEITGITEDDHYAIEALVEWLNQQDDFGMDLNNTYFRIISDNQVYIF